MSKKATNNKHKQFYKDFGKSVPKPPAQNTTLLQGVSPEDQVYINSVTGYIADKKNFIIDRIVIFLLFSNGLRISEVLNIKQNDIDFSGNIIIHSLKKSNIRRISAGQFSEWILNNKVFFISQLSIKNRWYYYRLIKKKGWHKKYGNNKNYSVTHAFRYEFLSKIDKMTDKREDTAILVGHRNSKNTSRYINKKNSRKHEK